MRKSRSKTHFEQIPVEEVKKIAEVEVGKQKQSWIDDITDVIGDVPAKKQTEAATKSGALTARKEL